MPDTHSAGSNATPPDWNAAFAALPLENPPNGGWARLSVALPGGRQHSRARYWIPAAIAASLALVMVWPRDHGERQAPVAVTPARSVIPPVAKDDRPVIATLKEAGKEAVPSAPATASAQPSAIVAANEVPTARAASTTASRRPPIERESTPVPLQLAVLPDPASARDASAGTDTLESLYAESAQLESLLAQISDDRVASGPAMALSAQLHDRVAGIDAALSQPDIAAGARLDLWRERVATLQRLTGVEGTQRWMAANGYRADGEVARIY